VIGKFTKKYMQRPPMKVRSSPVKRLGRKARWLGLVGGLVSRLFQTPQPDVTCEDLRRHDHSTNTQRMGVRFTERIRDVFRFRWIREIF